MLLRVVVLIVALFLVTQIFTTMTEPHEVVTDLEVSKYDSNGSLKRKKELTRHLSS